MSGSTARLDDMDVANLGAGVKIATSFVLRIDAAFFGLALFCSPFADMKLLFLRTWYS